MKMFSNVCRIDAYFLDSGSNTVRFEKFRNKKINFLCVVTIALLESYPQNFEIVFS